MDPNHRIAYRLFREHCVNSDGVFVKDLGLLGREMQSVVMIDNSKTSYKFQPKNGIECTPFIDNFEDRELLEMSPFLEYLSKKPVVVLQRFHGRTSGCSRACGTKRARVSHRS